LFYATALVGAGAAAFGALGLALGGCGVAFWTAILISWPGRITLLDLVMIDFLVVVFVMSIAFGLGEQREPADVTIACRGNLARIALALHAYHEANGSFPPAFVADETGRPMHSWRVLILPYLNEHRLYNSYRFDEPWDGPHNRRLERRIPKVYQCPNWPNYGDPLAPDHTMGYFAVVGQWTAWPGPTSGSLEGITDGPESTVLLVEDSNRVSWLAPVDLSLEDALRRFPSSKSTGPHRVVRYFTELQSCRTAVFADGHPALLREGLSAQVWSDLLSARDGSSVSIETIVAAGRRTERLRWEAILAGGTFVVLFALPIVRTRLLCRLVSRKSAK
jgi:hypothetical protein